jgi:carbohydrate-binding DOMON domain-containing protein
MVGIANGFVAIVYCNTSGYYRNNITIAVIAISVDGFYSKKVAGFVANAARYCCGGAI